MHGSHRERHDLSEGATPCMKRPTCASLAEDYGQMHLLGGESREYAHRSLAPWPQLARRYPPTQLTHFHQCVRDASPSQSWEEANCQLAYQGTTTIFRALPGCATALPGVLSYRRQDVCADQFSDWTCCDKGSWKASNSGRRSANIQNSPSLLQTQGCTLKERFL